MRKFIILGLSCLLAAAAGMNGGKAEAAVKLNIKKAVIAQGDSVDLCVNGIGKNTKVKWSTSKNVKLVKQSTSAKVEAVGNKKGSATVVATVKIKKGKKWTQKKYKCKISVKNMTYGFTDYYAKDTVTIINPLKNYKNGYMRRLWKIMEKGGEGETADISLKHLGMYAYVDDSSDNPFVDPWMMGYTFYKELPVDAGIDKNGLSFEKEENDIGLKKMYAIYDQLVDIVKEAGVINGMAKDQAYRKIAEWMCQNCEYDYELNKSLWTEMIKYKKGVCNAYSQLTYLLCQVCSIHSKFIISAPTPTDGYCHAFNQVYLNGEWYYSDLTFSDNDTYNDINEKYYLSKTAWDDKYHEVEAYFGM